MAGLLDAFNDPQFQRGLMMFAASLPQSEQSRAGLLSYVDQQEEAKARREYMQLQMEGQRGQNEANRAKTAAAQAKLDFDNNLFGALMGGGQPQGAGFAPGSVAPDGSRPNAGQGGFIAGLTPDQLAALSMRGHDFTKQYELTRPDMQVANGYAYDKRTLAPGFMPSLQTTADGKSTMTQIGPNGMPIVSAPQGALGTYGAYKGIDANIAAQNDLIQNYNPETGRMEFGTRAQAVRAANGQPAPMAGGSGNIQSSGYAGGDRSRANAESIAIMKNELMQPGLTSEDKQAIRREISRLEGQTPGAMAAGPSAAEQAQQEAARARLVDTAKADVTRDSKRQDDLKRAGQLTSVMDEAIGILKQGPTASLTGAGADRVTNALGINTKGAELAQRLEALSGWAVSNVPRMEGPQSDRDVINYMNMAGRVGDRTVPVAQRIAAAEQVKALQQKYSHLNGGERQEQAPQKASGKSFSDYGYSNAQEMIQDARNAIMRNPGARDEVNRRLSAAGLSLNTGGW